MSEGRVFTATAEVRTITSHLHSVVIAADSEKITVSLYDNTDAADYTAAAGTKRCHLVVVAGQCTQFNFVGRRDDGISFTKGIYMVVSGSGGQITVVCG